MDFQMDKQKGYGLGISYDHLVMHKLEWYFGMVSKWMDKKTWNLIECYYTNQGSSVPSKMWSMQQRLYRLTKFLGQGLWSAQLISR
jgi:hypothetical protein